VEEVGQHPDAALLDLGRLRVLGVVDEVPVQVLADQLRDVRAHPGRDEGRQVLLGVAVQEEFLLDQKPRVGGVHRAVRQLVIGRRFAQEPSTAQRLGRLLRPLQMSGFLVHP
jgi:hypothetical protein